ncbi:MAG: heparinase II/III-family protein [Rhodospirillales bacterium]|nr:heparinase II/III-family protein [Rhodospirillales bacterium]
MLSTLTRKVRQVVADPVLRRWLFARLTGKVAPPPPFAAHRPPYLDGLVAIKAGPAAGEFRPLAATPPTGPIELPLAGTRLKLNPGDEGNIFARPFGDIESLLALHRFAWVPLAEGSGVTASWVQALWDVWRGDFGVPDKGWAWHPYTAAERAINILDFADKKGLPEPIDETVALLAAHAEEIFENLEYFGEHNTSNHLANNGRGLYRLGLALGIDWAAEAGAKILEQEAKRILMRSGVLREGSSHYHLLIARNYADAWLAARAHGHPEEDAFRDITTRVLAVIPWLILPGGMPLIGDVSPDCPPDYLLGLAGLESGWLAGLGKDKKAALLELIDETRPVAPDSLLKDGLLRLACGPWTGLWHAAPGGWSHAPGHGHQDAGGFELHFQDQPVFIDPGRGAYGEAGEAARYRSAMVHNTLVVDGAEPFPTNKPYYNDAFRHDITGTAPELTGGGDEVVLSHHGFARLKGVGELRRQWRFSEKILTLSDELAGDGIHRVTRRLITPMNAEAGAGGVVLSGNGRTFHVNSPDAAATVSKIVCWRAYGEGRPGFMIEFTADTALPWSGEIRVEVL